MQKKPDFVEFDDELIKNITNCSEIILDVDHYYTAESITSFLLYELLNGAGFFIPNIK